MSSGCCPAARRRGWTRRSSSSTDSPDLWLLPLLAGGGWEGARLLIRQIRSRANPSPTLPCLAGEGEHPPQGTPMPFNTIPEILEDIRAGRMVVILDDEDRENEGDL